MTTCGRLPTAPVCTPRMASWRPNQPPVGCAATCAGGGMSRWVVTSVGMVTPRTPTGKRWGLCRNRPLVATALSRSIATRQSEAYRRSPQLRARLAVGQELSKTGQLATLAAIAHHQPSTRADATAPRGARCGRMTRAARRDRALARRVRGLGFNDLPGYLRHAHSSGASVRSMARATGLDWAKLRRELEAAGVAARPARQQDCAEAVIAR